MRKFFKESWAVIGYVFGIIGTAVTIFTVSGTISIGIRWLVIAGFILLSAIIIAFRATIKGFIEKLVVFYLENSGHKITLYTKRWFVLANHFFLCYNIFRYFSIFGGFLLTLHQYLL